MIHRYTTLVVVVLAIAAIISGCGNSPVAVVNGVKITEKEFTDRLVQTFGRDILRDMIDRELIRQAAQDAGIEVTDEELNAEIEQAKQQFGSEQEFQQWLASRDLTEDKWREHVRMALLARKLAFKDVKYTEEDLRKFFEENKQRFARPATVSLSEIVVNSKQDAEEVLAQLKKGEASFEDLARRYSLSPATKERGGERPEMAIDNIPIEAIREAARTLPIGQVSDPIPAEGQWYIIKVRDRKQAREGSFELDRKLIEEQYQLAHARPLQEILKEQIRKSNITIVDPRFQELNELYTALPSEMPEFGAQSPSGGGAPPPEGQGQQEQGQPQGEGSQGAAPAQGQ